MKNLILTLVLLCTNILAVGAKPYIATAYCYGSKTSSGKRPAVGMIAASSAFKFGTRVSINGKIYTVEDRGSAITGNRVDIFMSCSAARQFGRRKVDLIILS